MSAESGLRAQPGYNLPTVTLSQRAWTALDGLRQRQAALPALIRTAAQAGDFEEVARLRVEWDALPARMWAATYTALHSELVEHDQAAYKHGDRHGLLREVTRLAQEAGLR